MLVLITEDWPPDSAWEIQAWRGLHIAQTSIFISIHDEMVLILKFATSMVCMMVEASEKYVVVWKT